MNISDRNYISIMIYYITEASWTQEEDQVLYHTVLIHGAQDWGYIASLLTDKNAKQARERWHHHINYNLKKVKLLIL